MFGGHHQDVCHAAAKAGNPEALSPANICCHEASCPRADEGAEGHEGGDELLSDRVKVPSERCARCFVAVDL